MTPFLETRELKKSFLSGSGQLHVLKGIDLAIAAGEFVSVVGASGAGKSTLLHLIGALDRPTSGRVLLEGTDIFAGSQRSLDSYRNRQVGFIFQSHHLLPEFTALENVSLPALVAHENPAAADARASAILDEVGLADRLQHRPGQLSGGEQQRVAVARALIMSPRLLLADEPTGNLDDENARAVFRLIGEIVTRRRLTVIMVTHNRDLAAATDRTLHLTSGLLEPA